MGHAIHFLERLSRVNGGHLQDALSLYYSSERARKVINFALDNDPDPATPAGEQRVALALDDSDAPPYLIATREGRMITCLAAGMSPYGLPVVPARKLFAACATYDDLKGRAEDYARLREEGGDEVFRALFKHAWGVPRRVFRALSFLSPWIQRELFSRALDFGMTLHAQREPLVKLIRRAQTGRTRAQALQPDARSSMPQKLLQRYDKPLRAYWVNAWATSHLTMLAVNDRPKDLLAFITEVEALNPNAQAGDYNRLDAIGWSIVRQGTLPLTLRGVWASAQLGADALPWIEQAIGHHVSYLGAINHLLPLGVIAARDPSLRPEAARLLNAAQHIPDGYASDFYSAFARVIAGVLDKPDDALNTIWAAMREDGRGWYGKLLKVAQRSRPDEVVGLPPQGDLPDELALLFYTFLPMDTHIPSRGCLNILPFCAPLLARMKAQDLFLPDPYAPVMSIWHPHFCADMLLGHAIYNDHTQATPPQPKAPNRNDPCPCGSGQKHKRCCGRGG